MAKCGGDFVFRLPFIECRVTMYISLQSSFSAIFWQKNNILFQRNVLCLNCVCMLGCRGRRTEGDKIVAIKSSVTVTMRRCLLQALRSTEDIFFDERGKRDRVYRGGN